MAVLRAGVSGKTPSASKRVNRWLKKMFFSQRLPGQGMAGTRSHHAQVIDSAWNNSGHRPESWAEKPEMGVFQKAAKDLQIFFDAASSGTTGRDFLSAPLLSVALNDAARCHPPRARATKSPS
ncbi:MAG: hypothetical protein Q8J78_04815 [Moraxellaceae bacterium]|nr:hypothetical protein [Moraxellaceae bacterium]